MSIRIRNTHTNEIFIIPSGSFEIIDDEDKSVFEFSGFTGTSLKVWGGSMHRHKGVTYDNTFSIKPYAANVVILKKDEYK